MKKEIFAISKKRSKQRQHDRIPVTWDCLLWVSITDDGVTFEIAESHEGGGIDMSFDEVDSLIDALDKARR